MDALEVARASQLITDCALEVTELQAQQAQQVSPHVRPLPVHCFMDNAQWLARGPGPGSPRSHWVLL